MTEPAQMVPTLLSERWRLMLPEYRAERHRDLPFWEKPRLDSMRANLGADHVLYDVGTEDGDLSALFATWVGAMVLIEPNPRVWPTIQRIWNANRLPSPVYCWPGFVGDRAVSNASEGGRAWPSATTGRLDTAHGFLELRDRDDRMSPAKDRPLTTLDRLAQWIDRPPTAITIDVEGAELAVLVGADGILQEHRPLVWVSIHPEMMRENYNTTPDQLVAFMATRGYRREHLAAEHEWHTLFWPEERRAVVLPYDGCSL